MFSVYLLLMYIFDTQWTETVCKEYDDNFVRQTQFESKGIKHFTGEASS